MLHDQADYCDTGPAACSEEYRFSAFLDQADDVAVHADRGHREYDEELAQGLERREYAGSNSEVYADCCDHRCKYEIKYEHREYAFYSDFGFFACHAVSVFLGFSAFEPGKNKGDRDDREGSCELDCDGFVEGSGPEIPHTVPC